jgi:hypothetical protein
MDRLTFPEFIEDVAVIFVVRGDKTIGTRDRFRIFCCME